FVVESAWHDVGPGVQHRRAAVHVQTVTRVARRVVDGNDLRAARSVHVRQLETDVSNAPLLPLGELPIHGDGLVFSDHRGINSSSRYPTRAFRGRPGRPAPSSTPHAPSS